MAKATNEAGVLTVTKARPVALETETVFEVLTETLSGAGGLTESNAEALEH